MSVSQDLMKEILPTDQDKREGLFSRFVDSLGDDGLSKWKEFLELQESRNQNGIKLRIAELNSICGLYVMARKSNNQTNDTIYMFNHHGREVTSFYTYAKAKAFAEGVRFGQQCKDVAKSNV